MMNVITPSVVTLMSENYLMYKRGGNEMNYCDNINDIIICVLNDVADKIDDKEMCTRENVNDILLEYTLEIHDIVLDEIMDRIEYY